MNRRSSGRRERGRQSTGINDAAEPSGENRPRRDWRTEVLAHVRALIRQADPDAIEDVKWRKPTNPGGVPVWSHDGLICTGETYTHYVKVTFAAGAALEDPSGLFNAGLAGNARRAIDIREGDEIDAEAFRALVRSAVALNTSRRGQAQAPIKDPDRE